MAQPWFLRAALEDRHDVVRLEVLHLDDELRTRTSIGPAKFETLGLRRTVIDDRDTIESLLTFLAETEIDEGPGSLDARWGLVFTNARRQRVFSLYLDKFGKRAAADGYELNLRDGDRIVHFLQSLTPDQTPG